MCNLLTRSSSQKEHKITFYARNLIGLVDYSMHLLECWMLNGYPPSEFNITNLHLDISSINSSNPHLTEHITNLENKLCIVPLTVGQLGFKTYPISYHAWFHRNSLLEILTNKTLSKYFIMHKSRALFFMLWIMHQFLIMHEFTDIHC